ncbi:methyltransferase, partial [Escherichia coli]
MLEQFFRKRLARTVLIFTESSDQLSRATDRVP